MTNEIMKPTLTLITLLLLAPPASLRAADAPTPAANQTAFETCIQSLDGFQDHGMPGVESKGIASDVIPFFHNGQFHLLHLQFKPGQKGWDWAQIATRDFVAFEHTGVAIPGGGADDAIDREVFTGSVIEKDGVLHAFYTGHNALLKKEKKPGTQTSFPDREEIERFLGETGDK